MAGADETFHGCSHYRRKCKMLAPCCDTFYNCRICHDEAKDHSLDRRTVVSIKCLQCNEVQHVGKNCTKCGIMFASYSCLICRLYDDTERGQYHCIGCGICRVGGRENFFHCDKCDMCIGIVIKDSHKCLEKISRKNCPVCMEDIHTSRTSIHVPDCAHLLHRACLEGMLNHGQTSCPVCNASLLDLSEYWKQLDNEVANTIMPEAFRSYQVNILCRDCHKDSKVLFHVIGMKCAYCGSYNTVRTGGDDPFPEDPDNPVVSGGTIDSADEPRSSIEDSWETVSNESLGISVAEIDADNQEETSGNPNDTNIS